VSEAIRLGYRHIDCAMLYGNEVEIGTAIRDAIKDCQVSRKELWITSKLWCNSPGQHGPSADSPESVIP
jgi:alcohol dehydrogenase (NADP+)